MCVNIQKRLPHLYQALLLERVGGVHRVEAAVLALRDGQRHAS